LTGVTAQEESVREPGGFPALQEGPNAMRSTRRGRTALLLATLLAVSLLGSGQAAAASSTRSASSAAKASWKLIDYQQRTCYVSSRGGTSYYGIWISGSWRHRINVGAQGMPAGGSYYTSYAPIPPGSSDGIGSLAYVALVLPAGAAVGTYTSSLWASDGKTRQSVPITEVVQATSCSHY